MDPLLQGLRDEGRLCSHGRFEVDRARQLEILRLDPHRAVLHLVRTAVLGGAGWMHIQSDGGQCDAEFPGTVAPSEEMAGVLSWLNPLLPQRHQLAMAVNAALSQANVELTSWDGHLCARLRIAARVPLRVELGREPPWREPRTRVRFLQRVSPSLFGRSAEHDLVAQLCPWAPLKLTLNHQLLAPPRFGHRRAAELRIHARHAPPGAGLAVPPTLSTRCLNRTVETLPLGDELEHGSEGVLVAALSLHRAPGALIKEGVRLGELPCHAIVSAWGLGLDLSQQQFLEAEGQALQRRLAHYYELLI